MQEKGNGTTRAFRTALVGVTMSEDSSGDFLVPPTYTALFVNGLENRVFEVKHLSVTTVTASRQDPRSGVVFSDIIGVGEYKRGQQALSASQGN